MLLEEDQNTIISVNVASVHIIFLNLGTRQPGYNLGTRQEANSGGGMDVHRIPALD